ncbi:Na+/H+ antiporter subunit E [Salinarimonas sp.]|uniref:Na+/H+ antiporter subunit E n=1 Tax=Salinarimonas sp. TaxID=2766526 RepID=UPI003919F6E5
MRAGIERFVLFAILWIVLTGFYPGGLYFAIPAVAAATWASLLTLPPRERRGSVLAALLLAIGFLWRSVLGGIDVARRAFDPRLPLAPGWRLVRTRLPEGGARVALASEISLLPGTLAAGSRGDDLLVHCLDTRQDVVGATRREEARIARAVGLDDADAEGEARR